MRVASLRRVKYKRLEDVQLAEVASDTSINLANHVYLAVATGNTEAQPGSDLSACTSQIQSLPQHLLDMVLSRLAPDDLMSAYQVCKVWHDLIQQDRDKCKRLAWQHKNFIQPGLVANFRTKRRLLSYTAERRLDELTDSVGKTMLLQF